MSRLGKAAAASRTSGSRVGRITLLLALGLLLLAAPAAALEPTTVSVLGTVELDPENAGVARDLALHAALVEAALKVARRFVSPAVMTSGEVAVNWSMFVEPIAPDSSAAVAWT